MRMNRKAEGSFVETMAAMMVVTIAVTAFMGVLAYTQVPEEKDLQVSDDFVEDLKIENGVIVGVDQEYIDDECTRKGFSSLVIIVKTVGDNNRAELRIGQSSESDFKAINGLADIPCSDGTTVLVSYEVVAFA